MPYHFVSPDELSTPKSGMFEVKVDEWWLVNEEGKLVFYVRMPGSTSLTMPQCNPDKRISDALNHGYEVKQIPLVFLPHGCSDYH